jgi:short-subunit dehydrogenase
MGSASTSYAAIRFHETVVMPLKQKRVILTGGSGGIGQLVAAEFLREGADLAVMSRSNGGATRARHLKADLSTLEGIAAACLIVSREEPEILVNLAGVQYFGPIEKQSLSDMSESYMINLIAPVALCKAVLPGMRHRNFGQLVNVGSVFGSLAFAHFAAYSSAKAGLRAFSEALRRELVDANVSVTHIAPRAVRTGLITPQLQKYAEITGMHIDDPSTVSAKIIAAVKQRRKDVCIGFPECLYARLNALLPRVVDAALARNDRRAKRLFAS